MRKRRDPHAETVRHFQIRAAAPDLYAALKAFVDHWDGYDDPACEWTEVDKRGAAILKQARAVLARIDPA